jgi:glycosyltransferase involved in cell wall biosynthesis
MPTRRKLNIAMIGQKGIPITLGGADNYVLNITTRLIERGHKATVYCRPYATKLWLDEFPPDKRPAKTRILYYKGVRLVTLPTLPMKNLDALFNSALGALHGLFQPYDIINYQTIGATIVSFISRLRPQTKVVASVLALDWARAKWNPLVQKLLKTGEYTSVKFAHSTQVISLDLKRYYDDKYKINSVYIPTGVELKPRQPLKLAKKYGIEEEKYLLFLSRLVPEKGAHYLIEAYRKLKTNLKLVVAGDARYEDEYKNRLKGMANSNVIFTGFVPDEEMDELFANAYVYILPSEIEGLPHSLLQGLSYGRCVVASDINPNREALGNCGYTFKNGNSESLREALQKLVDNPALVKAEYEKSIARVKAEYDWEAVTDKFEDLYYKTLGY